MILAMPVILSLAGYFVFSAAVGAMSAPSDAQKTRFYGWLYRFLQRLAANADKVVEARFGNLVDDGAAAGKADSVFVATRTDSASVTVASSNAK
jgi:hypothetical protein